MIGLAATAAQATPLAGTFSVTVWNASTNSGGDINANTQQALPSNPVVTGPCAGGGVGTNTCSNRVADDFSYTGPLNFVDSASSDTIAGFLATGGGLVTGLDPAVGGRTISAGSFSAVSIFEFTFTIASPLNLTITHDDGVSLFANGNTTTNLLPAGAAAPTVAAATTVVLAAGTYNLYYAEANGLPAQLTANVPEPASMALLGMGLAGLGFARRRRS